MSWVFFLKIFLNDIYKCPGKPGAFLLIKFIPFKKIAVDLFGFCKTRLFTYKMKNKFLTFLAAATFYSACTFGQGGGSKFTEVWAPEPVKVKPGKINTDAPSDAIILFDGKNLNEWVSIKGTTQPVK